MTWNVPDDWNSYYRTCGICGGRYHTSGGDVCDCEYCEDCGEVLKNGEKEICFTCVDIKDEEMQEEIDNRSKHIDINDTMFQYIGPHRMSLFYIVLKVLIRNYPICFKPKWVHKDINFMKHTLEQEKFIELCGKVYKYNVNNHLS